ncbi:MAG: hypothetical protein HQM08_00980 [Candidatus Riflebacteria bacterium]|nr:hypothetical protein [Candidatus Riflebacteria bacterium]
MNNLFSCLLNITVVNSSSSMPEAVIDRSCRYWRFLPNGLTGGVQPPFDQDRGADLLLTSAINLFANRQITPSEKGPIQ